MTTREETCERVRTVCVRARVFVCASRGVHSLYNGFGVTWINASFGHEGTAGEQGRLGRTIETGVAADRERAREREKGERNKEGGSSKDGKRGK